MKILAEYKNRYVYLVSVRQNDFCSIIETEFNEKTKNYAGKLKSVKADELTIVDSEHLYINPLAVDSSKVKEDEEIKALKGKSKDELIKAIVTDTKKANFNHKEYHV